MRRKDAGRLANAIRVSRMKIGMYLDHLGTDGMTRHLANQVFPGGASNLKDSWDDTVDGPRFSEDHRRKVVERGDLNVLRHPFPRFRTGFQHLRNKHILDTKDGGRGFGT